MNLIEEAVIIEVFGIRMYAFGAYVALGALCAVIVLGILGRMLKLKPGTVPLTAVLAIVCGAVCSRVAFCVLNRELGTMTPLYVWPQADGGGWSMFGLIGGVFLAGWISAKIMKERTGRILDALSIALLPLMAAERFGEYRTEDFDVSRPLDTEALTGTFLTVGEEEPRLATYYVAAAVMLVLFAVMLLLLWKRKEDGQLTVSFLLLFGTASIILESLRYDFFLSVSFVGFQQVFAAVMVMIGVALAIRYSRKEGKLLPVLAVVSLPLMVGAVIGLEFALDRTTWNKVLLYVLMMIVVAVPALLGMLLNNRRKGNAYQ